MTMDLQTLRHKLVHTPETPYVYKDVDGEIHLLFEDLSSTIRIPAEQPTGFAAHGFVNEKTGRFYIAKPGINNARTKNACTVDQYETWVRIGGYFENFVWSHDWGVKVHL